MATKETVKKEEAMDLQDQMTIVSPEKGEGYKGPTVRIFIPELEQSTNGMKVDQYEHVTIANEVKEDITYVRRGEWVEVPVPVYLQLKERYPKL